MVESPYNNELTALKAERDALAEEVRRLKERPLHTANLELFVAQCPLGIVFWNNRFEVVGWNPACEAIFGYPAQEALGQHAAFIVLEEERPHIDGIWSPLMTQSGGARSTNHNLRKGGKKIVVDWFNTTLLDADGQILGAVSVCEDISDKVEAILQAKAEVERTNAELEHRVAERIRQLEETAEQLGQFAYSVSHDLRGPLRSINGFSKALEEDYGDSLDAEAQDYIRRIRAGTMRLSALIDSLLVLSRVNRAEMRITKVDLSALAESVIEDIERGIGNRLPEATYTVQPNLKSMGDEALLRAVLNNLLENARKFSGKTEAPRIEFYSEDGAFVVRDNGAGFNLAHAERLFNPFQRLHTEREFPGDGIGLAVVKRIISRHSGMIWATSEPGQGATFAFVLPTAMGL